MRVCWLREQNTSLRHYLPRYFEHKGFLKIQPFGNLELYRSVKVLEAGSAHSNFPMLEVQVAQQVKSLIVYCVFFFTA